MATKIDIFSGFLGAGKTTLIKKLIRESFQGQQVVLIENEFGEIGIDGCFLEESGIKINELNAGCICCSLVGDFREALRKVDPDRAVGRRQAVRRDPRRRGGGRASGRRAVQLCDGGRRQQGQAVYEELRRVLQRPGLPRQLHPVQPHRQRRPRQGGRRRGPAAGEKPHRHHRHHPVGRFDRRADPDRHVPEERLCRPAAGHGCRSQRRPRRRGRGRTRARAPSPPLRRERRVQLRPPSPRRRGRGGRAGASSPP